MALWAISDLHLSLSVDKPMQVFGDGWHDYMTRLRDNWNECVQEQDCVVVCGDVSWATYLEDAAKDLLYISALPGTKLIFKGNHDYWWSTANKLDAFRVKHDLRGMHFMQNNHFMYNDIAICGTRGWQNTGDAQQDAKMFNRELIRLELSLKNAAKQKPSRIVAALHYPPNEMFVRLLKTYGVQQCLYGHLHAKGHKQALPEYVEDVQCILVSSDFLSFKPYKVCE